MLVIMYSSDHSSSQPDIRQIGIDKIECTSKQYRKRSKFVRHFLNLTSLNNHCCRCICLTEFIQVNFFKTWTLTNLFILKIVVDMTQFLKGSEHFLWLQLTRLLLPVQLTLYLFFFLSRSYFRMYNLNYFFESHSFCQVATNEKVNINF